MTIIKQKFNKIIVYGKIRNFVFKVFKIILNN